MKNVGKNVTEKSNAHSKTKDFSRILVESIDEPLSAIGEDVKVSVYFHLENKFGIKKHEIPQNIDGFSGALERIFGLGARYLEIMFMKNLYSKIGIVCKWDSPEWIVPEVTFQEYVNLMKQKFEAAGASEKEIEVFVDAGEKQEQYG